jgi:hypothetical protein
MGWSYRKSFSAGPFRINVSPSGISYSAGITGARVHVGPKGTYVHLSAHGVSYRRKISGTGSPVAYHQPIDANLVPDFDSSVHQIASASIEQLTDTDSIDFIQELSEKAAKISYANWFGILPLVIFVLVLGCTAYESQTVVASPANDSTLVRVTSFNGVYMRKAANPHSAVIKSAMYNQTYPLAGARRAKWLGVSFHDTTGYINRRFATVEEVHHDEVTRQEMSLINPYAGYELAGGTFFFILLIVRLRKLDKVRLSMALHYDMDEQFDKVYQEFGKQFKTFSVSSKIWQYLNAQQVSDFKRNAGAGKLIKRTPVGGIAPHQAPLPYFETNVNIPYIKLSHLELFFLPERLLIRRGNTFAAVFYKNLQINGSTTRFIEDESVPYDAQIVDRTWRFVNKSGGPDRRFNNNRQLPICAYSEYTLRSDTGIYEVITTSRKGAMDGLAGFIARLGQLQSRFGIGLH